MERTQAWGAKRRVWRMIHIGIDERTLEIRAAEFTTSDIGNAPMWPELLNQIPLAQEIASVTADGAFDTRKCHEAIAARGAAAIMPPCKNAKPLETRHRRGDCQQRYPTDIDALRPENPGEMERIPPKFTRNLPRFLPPMAAPSKSSTRLDR